MHHLPITGPHPGAITGPHPGAFIGLCFARRRRLPTGTLSPHHF